MGSTGQGSSACTGWEGARPTGTLCGVSSSGSAGSRPQRFRATLTRPSQRTTAADYGAHRLAFLRSIRSRPPGEGPRAGTLAGLAAVARVLGRPGRFDALFGSITAPVLIVHAGDDHHVPVDFALAAAARHPGWEICVLDSGGHHARILP